MGTLMSYLHTELNLPSSNILMIIRHQTEGKHRFRAAANLLF
jgi:hypothetical protein